jgi:hypothetical protein
MSKPQIRPLGAIEGENGETLHVGVEGGKVAIYFGAWMSADGVVLDVEARDQFARLWMEAERQAEAQAGAAP